VKRVDFVHQTIASNSRFFAQVRKTHVIKKESPSIKHVARFVVAFGIFVKNKNILFSNSDFYVGEKILSY